MIRPLCEPCRRCGLVPQVVLTPREIRACIGTKEVR